MVREAAVGLARPDGSHARARRLAVGIDRERRVPGRKLDEVRESGDVKFLRGGYGCGKTFMARLVVADALVRRCVTSFVVVSDNDLHFYRFDERYKKIVSQPSSEPQVTCRREGRQRER